MDVEYANRNYSLPLLIINAGTTALFRRNWLCKINLDWHSVPGIETVHHVSHTPKQGLTSLLKRQESLFDSGLGCYNGPPEQLKVKGTPKIHKDRPVAYAQKPKVEKALTKMEEEGVIKRVNSAPCAAPIVVVNKRD